MIIATLLHDTLEVKIVSRSRGEFDQDLTTLREAIDGADRTFVDFKGVWVVRGWQKYQNLSFVQAAVQARRLQPDLFQEEA